ncbi:guanitoxin biosynthesis MATE family efflux transporter GntT [Microseira wollei]|uniref:DNA-damage-inducible protein, putative n=1 Tax=Microseira wollei NIES-4236 TaxID=2530354 RepID=A0AAV3XA18_9CYAN|nr:guanitoxin biosynthesis MATE family efflux transporter GntT [Microseira wollei]GET39079.1 DNA-damage-inducible protein, putative [Microseira wollei NIES-4236]
MQTYNYIIRFFRLAIANTLSNIMIPLAGLISLTFVGHLSNASYLSGIIMGAILFDFIYQSLIFVRMATTGLTAQAVGSNNQEEVLLIGFRNSIVALGLGIIILVLQHPLQQLGFAILSGTPEVELAGIDYFNARIWGAPAVLLNFAILGWLMGREEGGKVLLLSLVGNSANIALSYLFVVQWNWASMGAGFSETLSQYLMLLLGLILIAVQISRTDIQTDIRAILEQSFRLSNYKSILALNTNILVKTLTIILAFLLFNYLSSEMGTITFTQNGLMLNIAILTFFLLEGVEMATESLTGNAQGKGEQKTFVFLLGMSGGTNLVIGLTFALACVVFPQTILGLLTNHGEFIEGIYIYTRWLILVLGFASLSFTLEGFFLGLAEGRILRNASLACFGLGFTPVAFAAWYFHSNHLLWLSLSMFMLVRMLSLGTQLLFRYIEVDLQDWVWKKFITQLENKEE